MSKLHTLLITHTIIKTFLATALSQHNLSAQWMPQKTIIKIDITYSYIFIETFYNSLEGGWLFEKSQEKNNASVINTSIQSSICNNQPNSQNPIMESLMKVRVTKTRAKPT